MSLYTDHTAEGITSDSGDLKLEGTPMIYDSGYVQNLDLNEGGGVVGHNYGLIL